MPVCPVCGKQVSILQWDIFGRGCGSCVGFDPAALEGLLDDPCPQCGSGELYATLAPALAVVQTKNGPVPSKVAPGFFVIGCSGCGHASFKFNREGAKALRDTPGWIGREQLRKRQKHAVNCPGCHKPIDLRAPSGVRISDDEPKRIYCEACNTELTELT